MSPPPDKAVGLPDDPIPEAWEPKNLAPWWVRLRFWLQERFDRG